VNDYDDLSREELLKLLETKDEMLAAACASVGDKFAGWFKVDGRADDLPLKLKKSAKVTLHPVETTVELLYPQPRDWPEEVVQKVMTRLMEKIEHEVWSALFGQRAMAHRSKEREVSIRKRTRGYQDSGP
jgi:hypothetical protein